MMEKSKGIGRGLETKRDRNIQELRETPEEIGGIIVTTGEAMQILREAGVSFNSSTEGEFGKTQKYLWNGKTYSWTTTNREEPTPVEILNNPN